MQVAYGAGAHSVKDTLSVSEEEAAYYIQAYLDGFPGLEENFVSTKKLALQQGWFYLDMFTKKKYHFPWFTKMNEAKAKALSYYPKDKKLTDEEKQKLKEENPELPGLWKEYNMLKGSLERRSLNYRIQGCSASMTKLACILIEDMGYQILNIVHDEILVDCTEPNKGLCSQDVKNCMIKAGNFFCKSVPMDAVPEVGTYWIH